ncbi:MAG: molybdenum cofactor guanylyltransferase [Planctomycetes bacterium]|nr:molybdenum cofactor guanylyltransferase [Planctomycetota bacterium]MCP4772455.1 molybdenum cofactor guanylyltransferase [Planctomycetota bacterium]MCP4860152.1 molybdenum cofactor guanylyltransferase [Planctomycetota bacterium]
MTDSLDCPAAQWTALLLAGGQSKRMGTDKRHLVSDSFEGRSLMEHTAHLMGALCAERFVLVASDQEADLPSGFTALADRTPGQGPLPAICNALEQLQTPLALILPVDMPCLTDASVRAWMRSFEKHSECPAQFLLDSEQRPTFPLLVRQEFRTSLAAELESGQVRLFQGLRAAGAAALTPVRQQTPSTNPNPFLNLNQPADLERLESENKPSQP